MANARTTKAAKAPVDDVAESKATVRKFEPTEPIECVSVTAGRLMMIGRKTGNLYDWMNCGDTAYVEYQDLKAEMLVSNSPIMYDPMILINDPEVYSCPEFAKLSGVYKDALTAEEIDEFFNLPIQQFGSKLKKLPKGIQNTIKSIAAEKLENGTLDSINKIKILDATLGTDLYNLLVR